MEFKIIESFQKRIVNTKEIILGSGDDAAIIDVPSDHYLVVSTDALIAGVHFLHSTSPEDIAYKALAVNLSDMAAMGATPKWLSVALVLPFVDDDWLKRFSDEFFYRCKQNNCVVIGGDLTSGSFSIVITIHGLIPKNVKPLLRSDAQVGDKIFVTGTLGDAAIGLNILQDKLQIEDKQYFISRLHRPTPRIAEGLNLSGFAHAAIDISDGLIADLSHILKASSVGATIDAKKIPLTKKINFEQAIQFALSGGDDYELCFTAKEKPKNVVCTEIGIIEQQLGLRILNFSHNIKSGYEHF